VHRLDRPTSGALLVAKDSLAHAQLDTELREGRIERSYLARVAGVIADDELAIEAPIGRDTSHATRRAIDPAGQAASSRVLVLAREEQTTLVRLWPITGRTHQLRVHLAHLGHPILGDRLYGGPEYARLLLHAWQLSFALPWKGGERVEVTAEPPAELGPGTA
jgi:RluA family pseudouridine synthase